MFACDEHRLRGACGAAVGVVRGDGERVAAGSFVCVADCGSGRGLSCAAIIAR
jgi:hypothetical protein